MSSESLFECPEPSYPMHVWWGDAVLCYVLAPSELLFSTTISSASRVEIGFAEGLIAKRKQLDQARSM